MIMPSEAGPLGPKLVLLEEVVVDDQADTSYLENQIVKSLSWSDVNVTVPDRETKTPKQILTSISGEVMPGELLAIMGPSGCGKTTLLNVLAHRKASAQAQVVSRILINDLKPSVADIRQLSAYVECDDALIGSLTVRETIEFAAQLSLSKSVSASERLRRIEQLLRAFGLVKQADTIIGTLIKKGISTGQKRRTSVAAQLIASPKILFLDEPTSGLDSEASFNVMSFIRDVAKMNNLIVIASIHQPSTTTFELFDKLLLLSGGKTCYYGQTQGARPYFDSIGFPMPNFTNPADFMLSLTNIDFERDVEAASARLTKVQDSWNSSPRESNQKSIPLNPSFSDAKLSIGYTVSGQSILMNTVTLLHRSWIKSHRDILVYGLRFGMYLGLAILTGTVWLRLDPVDYNMQPWANCIFFGTSFMSFMAVVYVPAFIEDQAVFQKDRANGLYGSLAFMVSNFLIGLPWLFIIAVVPSIFVYWMSNFRPDGTAFMTWIMWVYLNLVAAESLVVLMSSIFPNFVGALALTAMVNGLWMTTSGIMVQHNHLNPFYRYVLSYINYQAYVMSGLLTNEFGYRDYVCARNCYCQYDSPLRDQCMVAGPTVLATYGIEVGHMARNIGIMFAIILVMRLMAFGVMIWRK